MSGRAELDWTFGGAWPFRPRWFESPDGRLHYIDEGPRDGRPVVLVHGNPTWGFVYRNFVGPLAAAGHRVIVPDHLGFGRSDKPHETGRYELPRHIERFDALLESLDLRGATVVPQDWAARSGCPGRWPTPSASSGCSSSTPSLTAPRGRYRSRCRCGYSGPREPGTCW